MYGKVDWSENGLKGKVDSIEKWILVKSGLKWKVDEREKGIVGKKSY